MDQTHSLHKKQKLKLSIIIPVYNEQSTVASVVDQVCGVELPGFDKEIIIADDGSRDDTPNVLAKLTKEHTHHSDIIKVHTSLINLGKGAAIRFGLEFATGDLILIQDADLEYHPSTYPALLEPILRGEAGTVLEGKKIGWVDGLEYIFTLLRYRFFYSHIGAQVELLTINPDSDRILH